MALVFHRQNNPVYDSRVAFIQLLLPGLGGAQSDGKFGSVTEEAVKAFQHVKGLPENGQVDEPTGRALELPYWDEEIVTTLDEPFRDPDQYPVANHQFPFKAEVAGGHFSARPQRYVNGKLATRRALRANNPGALNISTWQKAMPGYVGRTQADAVGNKTTIYLTPEKGVGAWYRLIVVRYEKLYQLISHNPAGKTIDIKRLAKAYGLGSPDKADDQLNNDDREVVSGYLAGWRKWSDKITGSALEADTQIDPANLDQMIVLASGMFSHEASFSTPLTEEQIRAGISQQINPVENLTKPMGMGEPPSPGQDLKEEDDARQLRYRSMLDRHSREAQESEGSLPDE